MNISQGNKLQKIEVTSTKTKPITISDVITKGSDNMALMLNRILNTTDNKELLAAEASPKINCVLVNAISFQRVEGRSLGGVGSCTGNYPLCSCSFNRGPNDCSQVQSVHLSEEEIPVILRRVETTRDDGVFIGLPDDTDIFQQLSIDDISKSELSYSTEEQCSIISSLAKQLKKLFRYIADIITSFWCVKEPSKEIIIKH